MESIDVTADQAMEDWRKALGLDEIVDAPDAKTAPELAEMFDVAVSTARRKAKAAVKAGRMEKVRVKRGRTPQDAWLLVE